MHKQSQGKLNWRLALGALAIFLGAFSISESPANATPYQVEDSFKLAQVGIRSRVKAPRPLNLRPRRHFPLPTRNSSRRRDYYGRSGYRGSVRGRGRYRGYDCDRRYDYDHHTHRRRNPRRRGNIIIINPSNSNYRNYSNYDSYIRVIRK